MDPWFDPACLLLAGHLIHAENNALRRKLLYVFARWIEIPLLRLSFHAMHGRLRFIGANVLLRGLFKHAAARPFARFVDTAHPMITEDVLGLLDEQDAAIAIGPCRCRLAHEGCAHRMETDMVIRTGTEAFTAAFPRDYRRIDREEAKTLVRTFADEGLWHMVFLHCPDPAGYNEYAICNCCTCGCVPFMLNKFFGQEGFPLVRGERVAETIPGQCRNCGECLAVCPWAARTSVNGAAAVDAERCFGCGLCVRACPNGAVVLRRARPRPPLRTYQARAQ